MKKNLIYGLYCPFTDNLHYIGKSTICMVRPLQHMKESHSEKINIWVSELKLLGYQPIIKVLEECNENDNLDDKEKWWIDKANEDGCYLLNVRNNTADNIIMQKEYDFNDSDIFRIAKIIRETRYNLNIRQEDLCAMANVSRPTLSMAEKGNKKIVFYNLKKILNALGYEIIVRKTEKNEIEESSDIAENSKRVGFFRRKNQISETT